MYIVLDGKLRISTHQEHTLEVTQLSHKLHEMQMKRAGETPTHVAGQTLNKFKVAASTFILFKKLGVHHHNLEPPEPINHH